MALTQPEYEVWCDAYARQLDPARRRALLDEALAQDAPHHADHLLRDALWQKRYEKAPTDGYIHFWMDMLFAGRSGVLFRGGRVKKTLQNGANFLTPWQDEPPTPAQKQVLEEEWTQAMRLYLHTCVKDSKYASQLFGMMKMQDDALRRKLGTELLQVTEQLPRQAGMQAAFDPVAKAAERVFCESFADGAVCYAHLRKELQ